MGTSEGSKAGPEGGDADAAARAIELPESVRAFFEALEFRKDSFEPHDVSNGIEVASRDVEALSPAQLRGVQAELAAFRFSTHYVSNGGPWGTYFQPLMTATQQDGTPFCSPDLARIDQEMLAYWMDRALAAKHPVLIARYSDLVWDTTPFVTKSKRGRQVFPMVQKAIDSYIAVSQIDDGNSWGETREGLGRALHLAMSIKDTNCVERVINAIMQYAERDSDEDESRTCCNLFDHLLPLEDGPTLTPAQEARIIDKLESQLTMMAVPGGGWDVVPQSSEDVGTRLAKYYQRKNRGVDRTRVLGALARAFERRAKIGDALGGLIFLDHARQYYLDAGLREDADRVQLEAQALAPAAQKRLVRTTVSREIPKDVLEGFLQEQVSGGIEVALERWALINLPDQAELKTRAAGLAHEFPMWGIFAATPVKLGHGHIVADVGDETGDPDGRMVHETAQALGLDAQLISWVFERLVREGLTAEALTEFILRCPFISADREQLIRRGVVAHFVGDYVQSIHTLVPQVEHALVSLAPITGKPSNKAHRTGRGVMQFKNLNDILAKDSWPVGGEFGENLRMYVQSALAHPKGLNIRNEVCHGLWSAAQFGQHTSERVLHILLVVSLIRAGENGLSGNASAISEQGSMLGAGPSEGDPDLQDTPRP